MESSSENSSFRPVKLYATRYTPLDVSNSPPIIFIHGVCGTNRTFKAVKRQISDQTKRKVYAIDLRNHGKSEWSDEYSIKLFADDLEHFMITEGIPKAVLVGHSLGGRIAIALAFRKPEVVEKLVVEDINLVDTEKSLEYAEKNIEMVVSLKRAINFIPSTFTEVEAKKKFQGFLSSQFPEFSKNVSASNLTLPFHKELSGKFVWDLNVEPFEKNRKNTDLVALDLSDDPVYNGEMLLLRGGNSVFLTEDDVDIFYKYIPNCQVHSIDYGFHVLHLEFPEKYTKAVVNFIEK